MGAGKSPGSLCALSRTEDSERGFGEDLVMEGEDGSVGLPTLSMPVIWEDERVGESGLRSGLFAVGKPSGTDVFQGTFQSSGYPRLWEVIRDSREGAAHAHRIDRYTSGVLLCATRGDSSVVLDGGGVPYLRRNWHGGALRKFYLCVIPAVRWSRVLVEYPIGGVSCGTEFRVLATSWDARGEWCARGTGRSSGLSLVLCELVDGGRTHQIRKHLKVLGSPILGDWLFGGAPWSGRLGVCGPGGLVRQNQALHAWKVRLRLPSLSAVADHSVSGGGFLAGSPSSDVAEIVAPVPREFLESFSGVVDFSSVLEEEKNVVISEEWRVEPLAAGP